MSRPPRSGAEALCRALESLGVEVLFGLPGTQNVDLFEALRRSRIRPVLATHELAATFMANGYARAGGGVGVVATIPGPGLTYACAALAEARHDSAALLLLVGAPATGPGNRFQLQALDQRTLLEPLVKGVIPVERAAEMAARVEEAHTLALAGEPGPVVVEYAGTAMGELDGDAVLPAAPQGPVTDRTTEIAAAALARRLAAARHPLLFVGQGAAGAGPELLALAERASVPVISTSSGRGVVPEDHPLALGYDDHRAGVEVLNELCAAADLILVLGAKLTHNGTGGFALRLPREQLVHVDASAEVLGANYPADLLVRARCEDLLADLLPRVEDPAFEPGSIWTADEIAEWRARLGDRRERAALEPKVAGGSAAAFFAALRRALPREGILVTDSGLHQVLARRHFEVLAPRGLILPSDFQSMGFGLPAAIGAALAIPRAQSVVALIGDGGFLMTGMEIVTAAREELPLTLIVFNDGKLNLIRLQQLASYGRTEAVELRVPDLAAFAGSVGVGYLRIDGAGGAASDRAPRGGSSGSDRHPGAGGAESLLREAIESGGVTIVEVMVGDSARIRTTAARASAKAAARSALGPRLLRWVKGLMGRVRP